MASMIEVYEGDRLLVSVQSSIVPPNDSLISIKKQTYRVVNTTYALDYFDGPIMQRTLRANVNVTLVGADNV